MPTSYVGGQNYHFTLLLRAPLSLGAAVRWASPTGYGSAPYISFVTPALRLSRIVAPIFTSARDSGRQTSLHIEICIGIDELKLNRYVGTKN